MYKVSAPSSKNGTEKLDKDIHGGRNKSKASYRTGCKEGVSSTGQTLKVITSGTTGSRRLINPARGIMDVSPALPPNSLFRGDREDLPVIDRS